MRCLCSLAAIASFLVVGWSTPNLRAEDESARLGKIMEQVAQTLDDAGLSTEAKASVLRDLKISLAKALDGTVEVEKPAADDEMHDHATKPESAASETEATEDRRDRPRQRMRAAQREQRRQAMQEPATQPGRFAIGVMLEKSEEPETEGRLVITEVFPGSPAAQAELKSGDVIRKLDGEKLTDPSEITRRVNRAGVEDKPLSLEVGRGEEVLTVEVKPSPRPGDGGIFGFGGPDWAFPAAPGMPGFGGWRDPQWRFPAPPPAVSEERLKENVRRLERLEQQMEQLRQAVEEFRAGRQAVAATDEDDSEQD